MGGKETVFGEEITRWMGEERGDRRGERKR
jgi:hypothetical protein